MVDTPISVLPAAGSANNAMELEVNNAGTSEKLTRAQVLELPSIAQREAFQDNLGEVQVTGTFTISAATHYKREVKLENPVTPAVVQLPAPNDAQFATIGEGHFCDIRVVSGTQSAQVTALTTNTFRHANGYSAAISNGAEDTIFLGFSRATAFGQIYRLHRLDDIWVLYGPYRITETDDLTLDLAIEDSTTEQLDHCNRLNFGNNLAVTISGREATIDASGGGALEVQDEGSQIVAAATAMDFRGSGVAVTDQGGNLARVTVTSGAGPGDSPFINVEDSGAVGNGSTDDTADIQTALDLAVGKCLVFPRRGPWRCAGELRIKGNCTVLGLGGAKIEYEGADGCMGVNSATFEYLKVSGLTFEYTGGATGNVERIAFATTNDLTKQSFDGGDPVEIDMMILEDCHFIRSKVLLNNGGNNQIICRHNRWTTPNATVKMEPYYLMVRFGDENDQGGTVEDRGGALIHHNTIIVHPSTADPSNTDIVKITGGLTKVDFHDNWIENLTPATTSGQVDVFTGGGQSNIHHNTWIDVSLHFKQFGPIPGWQDISVWSQSNINHNFWHFKTNSQGVANACIFHRASALTNINNNQFKVTASAQTYAIYLDNAEVAEDSGLGTNAPYAITVSTNTCWLENNNTHRFLNADPASFGDTEYLGLHSNMVLAPSGQSTTVCNAGSTDLMSIVGNTMINGSSIQAGASFEEAANIGVAVV